jgi:hypothetical protein
VLLLRRLVFLAFLILSLHLEREGLKEFGVVALLLGKALGNAS